MRRALWWLLAISMFGQSSQQVWQRDHLEPRRILHAMGLAVSPLDQSLWAVISSAPLRGAGRLGRVLHIDANGQMAAQHTFTADQHVGLEEGAPAISPSGEVVVTGSTGELWRVENGQAPSEVALTPPPEPGLRPAWGRRGELYLYGKRRSTGGSYVSCYVKGKRQWEFAGPTGTAKLMLPDTSGLLLVLVVQQGASQGVVLDGSGKPVHIQPLTGTVLAATLLKRGEWAVVMRQEINSGYNVSLLRLSAALQTAASTQLPFLLGTPDRAALQELANGDLLFGAADLNRRLVMARVSGAGKVLRVDRERTGFGQVDAIAGMPDGMAVARAEFYAVDDRGQTRNASKLEFVRLR